MRLVAGVDEAGRGPLAGPVAAAAVILPDQHDIAGIRDSKQLSAKKREVLELAIREQAVAWSVVMISAGEIDRMNILAATLLAMKRAVEQLETAPDEVLIDGNRAPELSCPTRAIIGGDRLEPCISAASILAKTARDRVLLALHERYPGYGFDRHKGYPTSAHLQALAEYGPCPEHRRSYAPVARYT